MIHAMRMLANPGRKALALALTAVVLGGCADKEPTAPGLGNSRPPTRTPLGIMEITISGIGSSAMGASALPVRPGAPLASGASFALTPVEQGGKSGIQLEPLSSGSFTFGERGNGGVRYVYATYRVRNASTDGTPYTTPRKNLTFLTASTDKTIGETAISRLDRFDGAALGALAATGIKPTGAAMESAPGEVASRYPDVLQVLTEAELTQLQALAPAGVELFPFGFVVRHATSTTTRTLASSPAPGVFEGVVTFAFKLPLQATPAEDPFTVSAIFLAVDDGETKITQSLEEQTPAGEAAFLARAQALGATMKTVLPGVGSYWGEAKSTRTVCTVRAAGSKAAPAGFLVQAPVASVSIATVPGPLWAGGSMTRTLDYVAHDPDGAPLPDVPVHLDFVWPDVLTYWGHRSVRMLPRRNRTNGVVTAVACGQGDSTPVRASGYVPIAAGPAHSLAIREDGTVAAWGGVSSGERLVPAGLTNVVQLAGGLSHSVALKSDGTVVAWGSGSPSRTPNYVSDVAQIATGGVHVLALRRDGTVLGWGDNTHEGQKSVPPGLSDVVQIAAGYAHSLALKADGTVVAWGRNDDGQALVPPGLTDVVHVAAGHFHSLALKRDGTVVAWGRNNNGQTNVPSKLTNVVQLAGGGGHSLALKADGTVVAWGSNGYGQLNVPAGLADVMHLATGTGHVLALKRDGTVVAWGWNEYSQANVPASLVAAVP
jgi:alpha-tubulin suppressor-like RCC1 family protein